MHAFAGLGFYPLGMLPSGSTYNNTLQIDGTAAFSATGNLVIEATRSIDCSASIALTFESELYNTISIDGTATVSASYIGASNLSVTIAGTSAFSAQPSGSSNVSITIAGVAYFAAFYAPPKYPFTAKLGTFNAEPGNIKLGTVSDYRAIEYVALSLNGTANLALASQFTGYSSVTISATAAISIPGGVLYAKSLTIAGTAAFSSPGGILYTRSLTIAGTGEVTALDGTGYFRSLTIAGTAECSSPGGILYTRTLSIDGTASIAESLHLILGPTLTIAGTASFSVLAGQQYFANCAIEGTAACTGLPGFSFDRDLSIDGTAECSANFIYLMNEVLSIDGTADISIAHSYVAGATLSISGTASLAIVDTVDWIVDLTIAAKGSISFENIYEVVYVQAVYAGFSADYLLTRAGDETAAATANFSAVAQCVFKRSVVQTVLLQHTVRGFRPNHQPSQTLNFTQSAACRKVHIETLTDTLTMTQEAHAARSVAQTLNLTHSATCIRVQNRSVTQTLNLTDSATRNNVISRSLEDTLEFNPPNLQKLPIIGSQNQTENSQFEYYVPNVYAVLVPRKCLIILGTPSQTIILPCPIWGDSQTYQGSVDLKRAMTGVTYTYVKKARTQKLKYAFELWTHKALELRNFFIRHSAEVMMLQNHNAETWLVRIANNPVELTTESRFQPKGEKYTVTLEFEGVKIGG